MTSQNIVTQVGPNPLRSARNKDALESWHSMIQGMENKIKWKMEMKNVCLYFRQWPFVAFESMEDFYNK